MLTSDFTQRFLFNHADIRGQLVRLNSSYQQILALHSYAPQAEELLGEFLAATSLLAGTIKLDGTLTLQAVDEAQNPIIMAEYLSAGHIRGLVHSPQTCTNHTIEQLLQHGTLAITITPAQGQRYQGLVALSQQGLAKSLEDYFTQSEQIQTRIWLAAQSGVTAGILLQRLPEQVTDAEGNQQQWQHLEVLTDTVTSDELLHTETDELLHRLYHQESVQVFEKKPITFKCRCSTERCLEVISTLGANEIKQLLEERGNVEIHCEFCQQAYQFNPHDLAHLTAQKH